MQKAHGWAGIWSQGVWLPRCKHFKSCLLQPVSTGRWRGDNKQSKHCHPVVSSCPGGSSSEWSPQGQSREGARVLI